MLDLLDDTDLDSELVVVAVPEISAVVEKLLDTDVENDTVLSNVVVGVTVNDTDNEISPVCCMVRERTDDGEISYVLEIVKDQLSDGDFVGDSVGEADPCVREFEGENDMLMGNVFDLDLLSELFAEKVFVCDSVTVMVNDSLGERVLVDVGDGDSWGLGLWLFEAVGSKVTVGVFDMEGLTDTEIDGDNVLETVLLPVFDVVVDCVSLTVTVNSFVSERV